MHSASVDEIASVITLGKGAETRPESNDQEECGAYLSHPSENQKNQHVLQSPSHHEHDACVQRGPSAPKPPIVRHRPGKRQNPQRHPNGQLAHPPDQNDLDVQGANGQRNRGPEPALRRQSPRPHRCPHGEVQERRPHVPDADSSHRYSVTRSHCMRNQPFGLNGSNSNAPFPINQFE